MNRIFSTILTVTLALLLPFSAMAAPIGKATFIKGNVDITSPSKEAKPLQVGDDIEINDVIRTKSASKAEITFVDGSVMRVAERSRVEVQNYVVNNENLNGTVKLYRGKIQNIVKTTGKAFGRLQQNKFEVHTPMAVVGVRGTNFFTYHQQFTGSTFQEGFGYGYSAGKPEEAVNINAGQSMVVRDVNQVPEVKEATESEMGGLAVETAPEDDQGNAGDTGNDEAAAAANDEADAAADAAAEDTGGDAGGDDAAATGDSGDAGATETGSTDAAGTTAGDTGTAATGGTDGGEPDPGTGPGPATGSRPGGMDLNLALGDVAPVTRTPPPGTTTGTSTQTATGTVKAALPTTTTTTTTTTRTVATIPVITTTSTTTVPTTIYIPPPITTTTTPATPKPFSSTLSGKTYSLTSGTMVEDEKRIYDNNGYTVKDYEYSYFDSGSSVPFGRQALWDGTVDWWEVYLPDSQYWKFTDIYPVSIIQTFTTWTPGANPISYYTASPTAEAWWYRVYDDYESHSTYLATQYGSLTGTMSGTGLWLAAPGSGAAMTLGGTTTVAPSLLFKMQITSDSTTVGGAYAGYLGGIINTALYGDVIAIYVKDSGEAGYVFGDFAGTASGTTIGGTGTIWPLMQTSSAGVTPATLTSSIDTGFIYGHFRGQFGGHANPGHDDSRLWNTGIGTTKAIHGQDWGIYALSFGIDPRVNNPDGSTTWSGRAYGEAAFGSFQISGGTSIQETGIWMTEPIEGGLGDPEPGTLRAWSTGGIYMTPVMIGTLDGTLRGVYTGTDHQWQALVTGYWKKLYDLSFNGALNSEAWQYGRNHTYRTMAYQQDRHVLGNAFYEWQAFDGITSGWSWLYNGSGQVTFKRYSVDGTMETWVYTMQSGYTPADVFPFIWNNNSLVSYSKGTYTVATTLASLLESGAPAGYTAQNWGNDYKLQTIGDFGDGLVMLGGLSDIWTATKLAPAAFVLAGEYGTYDDFGLLPGVYYSGINSANMYDQSWTIMNPADKSRNGSYMGFVLGMTPRPNANNVAYFGLNNLLQPADTSAFTIGTVASLYLDRNGNAGFLIGDYLGTIHENMDSDLFRASGSMFPTQIKASTGLSAASLYSSSKGGIVMDSYNDSSPQATGYFYSDNTFATTSGSFTVDYRDANTAGIGGSIGGVPWGMAVSATALGGIYSGTASDYWLLDWGTRTYAQNSSLNPPIVDGNLRSRGFAIGIPDDASYVGYGGKWSDNFIDGGSISSWIDISNGLNGLSFGQIAGTFDPSSSTTYMTWETIAAGISMDTKTFMAMAATPTGQAALHNIGLPAFAVGKTTMSGSIPVSGGSLNMTMTDVTFYAHSAGQIPFVWATDNVSGSFTGSPAAGNSGTLTGAQSPQLQATVSLQGWNNPAGVWRADINPGGNTTLIKNLDGNGTTPVKMYGQAGGAISGSNITGTAAGVNQLN